MQTFKISPLVVFSLLFVAFIFTRCSGGGAPACTSSVEVTHEDTTRSGALTSPERWRGTITVTGDILIGENCTLTVEAGTTVKFAANSDSTSHGSTSPITDAAFPNDPAHKPSELSGIEVWGGSLIAEGTRRAAITFTSDADTKEAGQWMSIAYEDSGSTLSLQNTVIEYGYYGVQISQSATNANVTVNNNTIQEVVGCGICLGTIADRTVTLTLSGNTISACGHEGIDAHENATLIIENSTFSDNRGKFVGDPTSIGGSGIVLDKSNSTVRNNTFVRNNQGINCINSGASPTLSGNTFGTGGDANDDNVAGCS